MTVQVSFRFMERKVLLRYFFSKKISEWSWCQKLFILILISLIFANFNITSSQTTNFATSYFQQSNTNFKSNLFRQEIARFEINVVRDNNPPLSITQVPRINKGDILKVRLLDEAINGIKLDQSYWDWTFLVTYINPNRRLLTSSASFIRA